MCELHSCICICDVNQEITRWADSTAARARAVNKCICMSRDRGIPVTAKMTSKQAIRDDDDSSQATQFSWIKDGGLVKEELKAVVSSLAKKLSSISLDVQREGTTSFLSLINSMWSLETHVARDSADLIAMEIR